MTEGSSSNDDETYILDDQVEFFSSKSLYIFLTADKEELFKTEDTHFS